MKKNLLALCLLFTLFACRKNDIGKIESTVKNDEVIVLDTSYTSDYKYNLNVVYFIPKDNPAIPDYKRRLSEILLWGQKFYGDQMTHAGYTGKTFGLLKDDTKKIVKIITIYGKLTKDNYTSSGVSNIQNEVRDYFTAHPTEKTSDHILYIAPDNGIDNPFFGLGKDCFAKDYSGFDIKYIGTDTYSFTKYFGGLIHELGHGLNLPHNCGKKSDDAILGMSLMYAGNGTLGKSPTFLTEADCAILNTNQIFQKQPNITYYGTSTAAITRMYAYYSATKQAIVASGKFVSSVPVTNVTYYLDPNVTKSDGTLEGTGVNRDYNAMTWRSNVIGTDSFYVEIPINELKYTGSTPYELKVKLIQENGNIKETIYPFTFENSLPIINIKPDFDKSNWTIAGLSSQETTVSNNPASFMIDNNLNTYWYSKYNSTEAVLPHFVTVDMGSVKTADGFTINQRQDVYRMVKDVEVMISSDNINWASTGNYVINSIAAQQRISFGAAKTFRYFKVVVKSNYDNSTNRSCIAEIGIYKN